MMKPIQNWNIFLFETCCTDDGMDQKHVSNHMKCVSHTWDAFVRMKMHFRAIPHTFMCLRIETHMVRPPSTHFLRPCEISEAHQNEPIFPTIFHS